MSEIFRKEERKTKRSKRIAIEVVGGICCITVGILGGRATMEAAHNSLRSAQTEEAGRLAAGKQAAKIAVVNLDAGVEKNREQIYYANKIIQYPNENYQSTSLEEAKAGVESGQYGAYIIIPSTFSVSVDSINGTPEKAVFEYQISSNLSEEEREKIIYEVSDFEKSISTNVSYIYVDAILSEVHSVQDGASTILSNDNSEKKNLLDVSAESLIEPVEFSELKENNDTVKPIDLKEQSINLQKSVENIATDFDGWLQQGQEDYADVVSKNEEQEQALEKLEKSMESTNPLLNEKGEYNLTEGVNSVNSEIDANNTTIAGKRALLNDGIVKEINAYAQQNQPGLDAWKNKVQKSIGTTVVEEMQKQLDNKLDKTAVKNDESANQQKENIQKDISGYIAELQEYLNTSINSDDSKEVIKNIAELEARNAVEDIKTAYLEYGKYVGKVEVVQQYNTMITEINKPIIKAQEALSDFRKVNPGNTEEPKKPEQTVVPAEDNDDTGEDGTIGSGEEPGDGNNEAYTEALKILLQKVEALEKIEELEKPEEQKEPEVEISVNKETIDMEPLQKAVDLSKAVDKEKKEITSPDIKISILRPDIPLTPDAITYQVPGIQLPETSPIKEKSLKEIEEHYYISKDNVTGAFQEKVIDVIRNRNENIQKDALEKIRTFSEKQYSYQLKLDDFNPFGYVDDSKISDNITTISDNITGIETEMNEEGTAYLEYTTNVFTTANENINKLREDMTKATEETKKKVTDQIATLKNSRSETNKVNSNVLENFSKKLSFTRVGELPYREAYEFIVNPIEYQKSDK